ncbi:MAG: hypothetical protein ABIP79_11815 [Chitinophagaceae bacterium]
MDEEKNSLSLGGMLLISGASFIIFSYIIKILEGNHSKLLLLASAVTFSAGLLHGIIKILSSYINKKKKSLIS